MGQDQLDSTTKRTIMENEQMAGGPGGGRAPPTGGKGRQSLHFRVGVESYLARYAYLCALHAGFLWYLLCELEAMDMLR